MGKKFRFRVGLPAWIRLPGAGFRLTTLPQDDLLRAVCLLRPIQQQQFVKPILLKRGHKIYYSAFSDSIPGK
jgi:hypothetical protein